MGRAFGHLRKEPQAPGLRSYPMATEPVQYTRRGSLILRRVFPSNSAFPHQIDITRRRSPMVGTSLSNPFNLLIKMITICDTELHPQLYDEILVQPTNICGFEGPVQTWQWDERNERNGRPHFLSLPHCESTRAAHFIFGGLDPVARGYGFPSEPKTFLESGK
jgi:hypothetical protein